MPDFAFLADACVEAICKPPYPDGLTTQWTSVPLTTRPEEEVILPIPLRDTRQSLTEIKLFA
ncbi:MAG TPA: hypothetical protein VF458_17650 [Ktedonobacteraceae bacterium]